MRLLALFCCCACLDAQIVLHGPALEVHCATQAREAGIQALNGFAEARARVRSTLGLSAPVPVVLELVPDAEALTARVRACGGAPPEPWAVAVALPSQGRIILRTDAGGAALTRLRGLLAHEYAHIALGAALRAAEVAPVPRWTDEGLAQIAEGRLLLDDTPELRLRAFFRTLLTLEELEQRFPESEGGGALAYAQAESLMKWICRAGAGGSSAFVQRLLLGDSVEQAVSAHTGFTLAHAEERWVQALREDRGWMLEALLQTAFGAFVAIACVFAVSRIVRRRRQLALEMAQREALEEEQLNALEGKPGEVPGDDQRNAPERGEIPPPASRSRARRRIRWRTLRDDEPDAPL